MQRRTEPNAWEAMQQKHSSSRQKYIAQLTKEANKLAEHAGRKTIKKEDVDLAAKP